MPTIGAPSPTIHHTIPPATRSSTAHAAPVAAESGAGDHISRTAISGYGGSSSKPKSKDGKSSNKGSGTGMSSGSTGHAPAAAVPFIGVLNPGHPANR